MSTRKRTSVWAELRRLGVVLTYSPTERAGCLVIPPDAPLPDRTLVLQLFERVDDRCLRIDVVSHAETIASYVREVLPATATGQAVVH